MIPADVLITDPYGVSLDRGRVAPIQLDLGKRELEIGKLVMLLGSDYPDYLFRWHNRVYVWEAGRLVGDTFWLITDVEYQQDANGGWAIQVTAWDLNAIFTWRYTADYSGDIRTVVIGEAANAINSIATDAVGSGALGTSAITPNPARDISEFLDIAPAPQGTPLVYKVFAWQQTFSTMAAICQFAIENGTYVTFDVTVQNNGKPIFRVYKDQRGIDRRGIITLAPEYENLANVRYKLDYSQVATAVIAAGQGEETDREIVYVTDPARIGLSPFGYIESFRDARHIDDPDQLTNEAYARLNDGRPLIYATADLVERADSRWGIHFNYGDYVTVAIRDALFDCRIRAFSVSFSNGVKKVSVALEGQFRAMRTQSIEDRFTYLAQDEKPLPTP